MIGTEVTGITVGVGATQPLSQGPGVCAPAPVGASKSATPMNNVRQSNTSRESRRNVWGETSDRPPSEAGSGREADGQGRLDLRRFGDSATRGGGGGGGGGHACAHRHGSARCGRFDVCSLPWPPVSSLRSSAQYCRWRRGCCRLQLCNLVWPVQPGSMHSSAMRTGFQPNHLDSRTLASAVKGVRFASNVRRGCASCGAHPRSHLSWRLST